MKIDLDDLERKARAAQRETGTELWHRPGPQDQWWLLAGSCVTNSERPGIDMTDNGRVLLQANTNFQSADTLEHVAANSPPVTLALVSRIRELDDALSDALAYTIPGPERDRLVAVLARGAVLP